MAKLRGCCESQLPSRPLFDRVREAPRTSIHFRCQFGNDIDPYYQYGKWRPAPFVTRNVLGPLERSGVLVVKSAKLYFCRQLGIDLMQGYYIAMPHSELQAELFSAVGDLKSDPAGRRSRA